MTYITAMDRLEMCCIFFLEGLWGHRGEGLVTSWATLGNPHVLQGLSGTTCSLFSSDLACNHPSNSHGGL
jgi:hypothetical protein